MNVDDPICPECALLRPVASGPRICKTCGREIKRRKAQFCGRRAYLIRLVRMGLSSHEIASRMRISKPAVTAWVLNLRNSTNPNLQIAIDSRGKTEKLTDDVATKLWHRYQNGEDAATLARGHDPKISTQTIYVRWRRLGLPTFFSFSRSRG